MSNIYVYMFHTLTHEMNTILLQSRQSASVLVLCFNTVLIVHVVAIAAVCWPDDLFRCCCVLLQVDIGCFFHIVSFGVVNVALSLS
jgi:hypothetical protein